MSRVQTCVRLYVQRLHLVLYLVAEQTDAQHCCQQVVQSWHCSGRMRKRAWCSDCTAFYDQSVAGLLLDCCACGKRTQDCVKLPAAQLTGGANCESTGAERHGPSVTVMCRHHLLHPSRFGALVNSQAVRRRGCNHDNNCSAGLRSPGHTAIQFASLLCKR